MSSNNSSGTAVLGLLSPAMFDAEDPIWRLPGLFKLTITPEIAASMLDSNTENRTISWRKVNDYAREMRKGNWRYNPADSICFDTSVVLRNGQHRLLAVMDSETAQEFSVATGVNPDVQDVMDSGMKRTTAHQLGLSGYDDSKHLASMGRVYLMWMAGTVTNNLRPPMTPDIRRWVEESEADALKFAISRGKQTSKLFPLRSGVVSAAAFSAYTRDPAAADLFFTALNEGVGLDKGHPVLTLRSYLIRHGQMKTRFLPHHQLWLVVSTWNTWRQGRTLVKIMSPSEWVGENFPRMK